MTKGAECPTSSRSTAVLAQRRFDDQRTAAYSHGVFDAASELLTTPPRQPPPLALRRRGAAASPPSGEQPAGGYGPARRGSLGGAEGGMGGEGGVQMGFSSDWDPSAVLVGGGHSQPLMGTSSSYAVSKHERGQQRFFRKVCM